MSFVFNHSLASFPLFLYLPAFLRIPPIRGISNPVAFPCSRPTSERVWREKARKLDLMHALCINLGSFRVRFGFVLSFVFNMAFFVFNDLVGSFVSFFVFFQSPVSASSGTVPATPRAWWLAGPHLRQCVRNLTTTVGYHGPVELSSEKCGKRRACWAFPRPWPATIGQLR